MEGAKSVSELLRSDFEVVTLLAAQDFILGAKEKIANDVEIIEASAKELAGLGSFQSNEVAVAVAKMKLTKVPTLRPDEFGLVLDDIRDPGNLGTIVRIADWYGIRNIVASEESADFYNPKVISASMGSFCRVRVFYTSLPTYLAENKKTCYGTFMQGDNVHQVGFEKDGFIVIGNEARGISPSVESLIQHRISIPRYGVAESLNAAVATAVILDNLRRSQK